MRPQGSTLWLSADRNDLEGSRMNSAIVSSRDMLMRSDEQGPSI